MRWIPIDAKMCSIGAGRVSKANELVAWSQLKRMSSLVMPDTAELRYKIVFAGIEGLTDALAVMPTVAWGTLHDWAYDTEPLTGQAPLGFSLFMVLRNDLEECVRGIVSNALRHDA